MADLTKFQPTLLAVTNVVPRSNLRLKFSDLNVGEFGWSNHWVYKVLPDGRVFIDTNAEILINAGYQKNSLSNNGPYGDFYIERTKEGYVFHMSASDTVSPEPYSWNPDDFPDFEEVHKVVVHANVKNLECKHCEGRGIRVASFSSKDGKYYKK